ncbi:MAG: tRNA (adenosine(37)-N6)-threonylcarbamoyltransferase complex dimerization subunit type 1 TsaB [Cyanobacteria bacterium P01_F01_bin.42]
MAQFLLALDTVGSRLNLGLDNFAGVARSISLPLGRALSTDLHDHLQDFMGGQTWQELAAIAVVVGPGSYTGSRIGVVTARTLAQSLNIPLYGFSSLAIAASISRLEPGKIAISIPAQRNHVYGAIYAIVADQSEPQTVQPESNLRVDAWQEQVIAAGLEPFEFEYSEQTSLQMLEKMLAIASFKLQNKYPGNWADVLPNYAKK